MKIKNKKQMLLSMLLSKYFLPTLCHKLERCLKTKLPFAGQFRWKMGIYSELSYWDQVMGKKRNYYTTEKIEFRLSPNTFLPSYITSLFPDNEDISILDVGAGPLTSLEKRSESHHVTITAVDALGREYDMILKRHGIDPPVKTQYCKGEDISNKFAENSFDFVYARNSIDHCDIPEKAILGMLHVLKKDCYILLEHRENEAERGHYQGFHQWNFSEQNGKFIIKSKYETIDFSEKHKHICQTTCLVENGDWLVVKIRKL